MSCVCARACCEGGSEYVLTQLVNVRTYGVQLIVHQLHTWWSLHSSRITHPHMCYLHPRIRTHTCYLHPHTHTSATCTHIHTHTHVCYILALTKNTSTHMLLAPTYTHTHTLVPCSLPLLSDTDVRTYVGMVTYPLIRGWKQQVRKVHVWYSNDLELLRILLQWPSALWGVTSYTKWGVLDHKSSSAFPLQGKPSHRPSSHWPKLKLNDFTATCFNPPTICNLPHWSVDPWVESTSEGKCMWPQGRGMPLPYLFRQ